GATSARRSSRSGSGAGAPRRRRRLRWSWRLGLRGLQGLHVRDQLEHALLAHETLVGRHDVLVAGDDLGARRQDRLADVALVRGERLAGGEGHGAPEEPGQIGAARLRIAADEGYVRESID